MQKKVPLIYNDMCLHKVFKNSTLSVLTPLTGCEQYGFHASDKNEICLHNLPFNGRIKGFRSCVACNGCLIHGSQEHIYNHGGGGGPTPP
jgi:hypothetical protein